MDSTNNKNSNIANTTNNQNTNVVSQTNNTNIIQNNNQLSNNQNTAYNNNSTSTQIIQSANNPQIPNNYNQSINQNVINKPNNYNQSINPNLINQSNNFINNNSSTSPIATNIQTQITPQSPKAQIPQQQNNINTNINNQPQNITQDKSKLSPKEKKASPPNPIRKAFIILSVIGVLITFVSVGLLVYDNYQYNNYTITLASLVNYDTEVKNGITCYRGNYKYKIKRKEYIYTQKELSTTKPAEAIQVKYNPNNYNQIYDANMSKLYFTILFSGIGISVLSIIMAVAFTKTTEKEIITAKVIEIVNCATGKKIYLDNININQDSEEAKNAKYYVYFTTDTTKFAYGNTLNFNIYQHGEAFTTEKYKDKVARTIYEFENNDFTLI